MLRIWYGLWLDPDGYERECVVFQILDGPEEAFDVATGDPVQEYYKAPLDDDGDEGELTPS